MQTQVHVNMMSSDVTSEMQTLVQTQRNGNGNLRSDSDPLCFLILRLTATSVMNLTGCVPSKQVFALTSKGRGEAAILTTATDDLGW